MPSPERFRTIVADPPWQLKAGPGFHGRGDGRRGHGPTRDLPYDTMTVEDIAGLPVADVAEDHSHLYLWTVNAYIPAAYEVARAWGFQPSTLLTWCKAPMGSGLGGAYGISTEFCLFARRGSLPAHGKSNTTRWRWKRRYDDRGKPQHSAKPLDFIHLVESMSPGPYVELFSRERQPRLGWSYWGNQSLRTATLPTR
jgi:N6-adenosine-specific RNA methylase IME4